MPVPINFGHLHSRPWEYLPEGVINLLEINSLYAYWDHNALNWCVRKASDFARGHFGGGCLSVSPKADLEEWIDLITRWLL